MPGPPNRLIHPLARVMTFCWLACSVVALAAPQPAPSGVQEVIARLGLKESARPVSEYPGWRRPEKILVRNIRPDLLPSIQDAVPGVEVISADSAEEATSRVAGVDVSLGFCTEALLEAGADIRWIQVFSAGVERCVTIPAINDRRVLVTNMQRVTGPIIAEHVLAMMFGFSRALDFYIPERMAGRWTRERPDGVRMFPLVGKTVLVVGLGGIGTEVARRAHALGMRVVATRRSSREGPDYVDRVGLPEELSMLAAGADFIVNTAPLTEATRGLFDKRFFAAAKNGAYFINVGRGGSVVQEDLVDALRSGQIAGAGLDVTDPEPLPADSPLWKMQNVILTPHVATASDSSADEALLIVVENVRRYVAGERMLSVVDLDEGY
jgi:phosphoglycerate dehydrogenase-like enzyme